MAGESAREVAARSRAKAERLMRHAEMYERGADGEAQTASVLSGLPATWHQVHDVRWPGRRFANIDHIVIGPGGIFVIDSKNWSGSLTVTGNVLRQNGRLRETTVAACADSALAVSELVARFANHVHPVLCFVRDEPVAGRVGDVMICSTSNLSELLLTRTSVLTPGEVGRAARELATGSRAPRGVTQPRRAPAPRLAHFAPPLRASRPRRRYRSSSRTPSLGGFVVSILMLIGFVAFGPQLAAGMGAVISHQVTSSLTGHSSCKSSASMHHVGKHHGGVAKDRGSGKRRDC